MPDSIFTLPLDDEEKRYEANLRPESLAEYVGQEKVKEKDTIEQELGIALEWRELPERKESHLTLRFNADPTDRSLWRIQHEWLTKQLENFHSVFSKRIKQLDVSEYKLENKSE